MKLTSFLFAFTVGLVSMILLPLGAIWLNGVLALPVFQSVLLQGFGALLLLAGISLFVYCTIIFKIKGRGTPVPIEPPKDLVVSDIYQFTRNPIYLAYWLIIFGEFLIIGSFLLFGYLVLFMIANHLYTVFHEEVLLKKRFGASYEKYMRSVPRYLPEFSNSS